MNDIELKLKSGLIWTKDAPNVLTEQNIQRVRTALGSGWVCGYHLLFAAGASGYPIVFSAYDKYLEHVDRSRPGDFFALWSVANLSKEGLLLVDESYETGKGDAGTLLTPEALRRVEEYLSTQSGTAYEVIAAASFGNDSLKAVWTDLDGSEWDNFLEMGRLACVPGGAICVLPLTSIDYAEFYLLSGKRPNERGEVPLGGAY